MKKFILILLCLLFTGCSVVRIDTSNIDNVVDVALSKGNNLYNHVGKGYKYYVPRGVLLIDNNELNDRLYSNGVYYYLYVDTISYFYKIENEYQENEKLYYSKKIDNGYLEIKKQKNLYHITFYYNYARIEAVVTKDKIIEVVFNSSYILSTVKFTDNVIEFSLNNDYFTNKEEQYTKFKTKVEEEHFLKYVEEQTE